MQSFLFVFAFWLCIIFGYNLTQNQKDWEYIFTGLSSLFLLCGTLTGVIAICQWLTIDAYIPGMVDMKRAARPYANFAQPNNMATFLAGLYLYEKKKLNNLILAVCTLVIVFAVALSQSRTSWVVCVCILIYGAWQQYRGLITLKWYYTIAWLAIFVLSVFSLPFLTQLIVRGTDANLVRTKDVVARATGDMSRLAICNQMLHAISDQPWLGYDGIRSVWPICASVIIFQAWFGAEVYIILS